MQVAREAIQSAACCQREVVHNLRPAVTEIYKGSPIASIYAVL